MKTSVLASGSEGNCTYVETAQTKILLDIGTTTKYINEKLNSLNTSLSEIEYVLITHVHSDHIKALKSLLKKYNPTICLSPKMYLELEELQDYKKIILYDEELQIEDIQIDIIKTSHDTSDSRSFILKNNDKSLVYLTDTGFINQKYFTKLNNCNVYLFESNHDIEMLLNGPYPKWLKDRVAGPYGHLSNRDSSVYLAKLIGPKTHCIKLMHISKHNNTEEQALKTIREVFEEYEIDFNNISCAHQKERSELIEV